MLSIFQTILRKTEIINNYFKNFNMADLSGTKIIIIVLIYFWLVKAFYQAYTCLLLSVSHC